MREGWLPCQRARGVPCPLQQGAVFHCADESKESKEAGETAALKLQNWIEKKKLLNN